MAYRATDAATQIGGKDPTVVVSGTVRCVRSAEQHPESTGSERPGPEVLK